MPDSGGRALLAPGIYLDLPFRAYLADPAISASALKLGAADAKWQSASNPLWEEPESEPKADGTLMHKIVLEGRAAFARDFCLEPEKQNFPGALDTADEIRDFLRKVNADLLAKSAWTPPRQLKLTGKTDELVAIVKSECEAWRLDLPAFADVAAPKRPDVLAWLRERNAQIEEEAPAKPHAWPLGGTKDELVARALEADPEAPLWDKIVERFAQGRTLIKRRAFERAQLVRKYVEEDPVCRALLHTGLAEVSVIWIDADGRRCKARLDWLTYGARVDVKKFGTTPRRGQSLRTHLVWELSKYGYDIQAVWHTRAAEAMQDGLEMIAAGEGASNRIETLRDILAYWANDGLPDFKFLFLRCPGPPQALVLPFRPNTQAWRCAEMEIEERLAAFDAFAAADPDALFWLEPGREEEIDDRDDFPNWHWEAAR